MKKILKSALDYLLIAILAFLATITYLQYKTLTTNRIVELENNNYKIYCYVDKEKMIGYNGSAFFINEDTIITNDHVCRDFKEVFIEIDGVEHNLEQLYNNKEYDIKIFKVLKYKKNKFSFVSICEENIAFNSNETFLIKRNEYAKNYILKFDILSNDKNKPFLAFKERSFGGDSGSPIISKYGCLEALLRGNLIETDGTKSNGVGLNSLYVKKILQDNNIKFYSNFDLIKIHLEEAKESLIKKIGE
jgi:V8-like Glu-specific endopeptidase